MNFFNKILSTRNKHDPLKMTTVLGITAEHSPLKKHKPIALFSLVTTNKGKSK